MTLPAKSERRGRAHRHYRIGSALIDLEDANLRRDGVHHRLEPKQVGVLHLLILRQATPVTRDEFLDSVWGEGGSDEALNQAVSRLRRLLGDAEAIRTLPRVGYALQVPAEPVAPPRGSGLRSGMAPLKALFSRLHAGSFVAGFAAASVLAAVVFVALGPRTIEQEFEIVSPNKATEFLPLPG